MWEHEEKTHSLFWSNGQRERDKNWYYKINKEGSYIISLVWSNDCWQVCVSDKETLFTHRFLEEELSVAKLKGLLFAKKIGWNIKSVA